MMFLYSSWTKLPLVTRNVIANQFGIIKRGSTEVFDNQIKSDGYVISEIEGALNTDALQKFLVTDNTDMAVLFEMLVCKAEGREYTPPGPKRWCNTCDSKGRRHKKGCPKYAD